MTERRQRGAALLVVLVLVATLSFIALQISDLMLIASGRSVNSRMRSELLWRLFAAETLGRGAIETAAGTEGFRFAADNPFFRTPLEAPMDEGGAVLAFRDGSLCFNLNSLGGESSGAGRGGGAGSGGGSADAAAAARREFARVIEAADAPEIDAGRIASVVADWIDPDSFQEPAGAEDGHYASLPTPYRTAGARLADVSELRAMAGVDAAAYLKIRELACALPTRRPALINVNMLGPEDAPLLAGWVGAGLGAADAAEIIRDRPPGGYNSPEEFWKEDVFAGKEISADTKARARTTSEFIAVNAVIRYREQTASLTMRFRLDANGRARLVDRQIGTLP